MLRKFELDTSGVLIIASKMGLQSAFLTQEFNYDFPEGILPLIENGTILAIVTESGEDVKGRLVVDKTEETKGFEYLATQTLFVHENDEIFILSHSEFTQICSSHKGIIDDFKFYNKKQSLKKLHASWYTAKIYVKQPQNSHLLHFILELTRESIKPTLVNHNVARC